MDPSAADPTSAGNYALILLLVYVGLALVVSFVCSVLEAALLSSRVAELEARKSRGDRGASLLLKLKKSRLDDAISAILILNTIAHTAGVALAGLQAAEVWPEGSWAAKAFPWVLALLILILTEIIPKTLGAVYASRLVGPVARILSALIWLMTGVLAVTRVITSMFANHQHKPISRGELAAMVALAAREGTLEDADSLLVSNVLRYHQIEVEDVMTPRTVITMLPSSTTIAEFLEGEASIPFSRIPLFDDVRDNVVGYVLQREVLAAAARGADRQAPLSRFNRKALYLPEGQSVDRALRRITEGREHLALVTDEYGGISGLVTLEDLIETILGIEILDESDRVVDLRQEAVQLRERRLKEIEALRRKRAEQIKDNDEPKPNKAG